MGWRRFLSLRGKYACRIFKLLLILVELSGQAIYRFFMADDDIIELLDNHFKIHQLEFNLLQSLVQSALRLIKLAV